MNVSNAITRNIKVHPSQICVVSTHNILLWISFVSADSGDAIGIIASHNVWVDHVEPWTDQYHDSEYYDGLLDTTGYCIIYFDEEYSTYIANSRPTSNVAAGARSVARGGPLLVVSQPLKIGLLP